MHGKIIKAPIFDQVLPSMQLNLTDEEAGVLLNLLTGIIEGDRHPMSRRLDALRRIRAKLPGIPSEPPAMPRSSILVQRHRRHAPRAKRRT
jgi:hypothetical protein